MAGTTPARARARAPRLLLGMLLTLAFLGLTPLTAQAANCTFGGGTLTIHLAGSEDVRISSDGTDITATYSGGHCTYTDAEVTKIIVTGSAGDNTVTLDLPLDEEVQLALGAGMDTLVVLGTAGSDTFTFTGAANGTLTVSGDVVVTGTDTAERVRVYGYGGSDTIDATDATCDSMLTLSGGADADTIRGSRCADVIRGGGGADMIYGYGGNDHLYGGAGADSIWGGSGNDLIRGGTGRDVLRGGSGSDRIYGDGGHDRLVGGYGNDLLDGGAGRDRCLGGPGRDTLRHC